METLIYGGSFNPPTKAHEAIIQLCLKRPDTEAVWVMPSADRFDKQHHLTDTDRLWMLDLMREEVFDNDPRVHISTFELDYVPRPTQTYKTVKLLANYYPGQQFRFVLGADSYDDMPNWQHGKRLQKELPLLLIKRGEIALPETKNTILVNCGLNESSTEIRERVRAGLSISQFVCSSVQRYIEACNLYVQ